MNAFWEQKKKKKKKVIAGFPRALSRSGRDT
jgi:hypothetical protein